MLIEAGAALNEAANAILCIKRLDHLQSRQLGGDPNRVVLQGCLFRCADKLCGGGEGTAQVLVVFSGPAFRLQS